MPRSVQHLTIWMRSRLAPSASLAAWARNVGAAASSGRAGSSEPIGTPLRYPAAARSRRSASPRSQPPNSRGTRRTPLVANVSRRRSPSNMASRVFSVGPDPGQPGRVEQRRGEAALDHAEQAQVGGVVEVGVPPGPVLGLAVARRPGVAVVAADEPDRERVDADAFLLAQSFLQRRPGRWPTASGRRLRWTCRRPAGTPGSRRSRSPRTGRGATPPVWSPRSPCSGTSPRAAPTAPGAGRRPHRSPGRRCSGG